MRTFPRSRTPVAALSSLFLAAACVIVVGDDGVLGSGHRVEESRDVASFSAVELSVPADVVVVVGEPAQLSLSGDDNLLSLVETEVRGGTLHIEARHRNLRFRSGLEVHLSTEALERFEVEGSGDVEIRGVRQDRFKVSIEGSGEVTASGSVDRLDARIEGSGDLRLESLESREAAVRIEGSGSIRVAVAEALHYSIEGSGDIVYAGSPRVSGGISGSGSVQPR